MSVTFLQNLMKCGHTGVRVIFSLVTFAFAGSPSITLAEETQIAAAGVQPRMKLVGDVSLADHWGVSAFALVTPGYAEGYVGPTWSPVKGLSLNLSAGIETADAPWRVAASVFAAHGNVWMFALVEEGGSGLWYKGVASYTVGPVGLGVFATRFDGVGPRLAVSHFGFELWAAPVYDFESRAPKGVVGLTWRTP